MKPTKSNNLCQTTDMRKTKEKKYDTIGEKCEGEGSGWLLAHPLECHMNYLHVDSSEGVHVPLSSPSLVGMTEATVSGNTKNWGGRGDERREMKGKGEGNKGEGRTNHEKDKDRRIKVKKGDEKEVGQGQ